MEDNQTTKEVKEVTEAAQKTANANKIRITLESSEVKKAKETLEKEFAGLKKMFDSISGGIQKAFGNLAKGAKESLANIGGMITETFTVSSLEEYEAAADRFGEGLAGSLFSLQENMGALETSIIDSVAPIASVVVPIINDAVLAVSDLVGGVSQVIGALFNGAAGTDALAQSAEAAAGSAAGAADVLPGTVNDTLSPQLQGVVDKILALVEPLRTIDLTNIVSAFSGFQTALAPLTQELFAGLEWAYLNLFVPLAAWTTEGLLPGFLDLVSSAMDVITETATALQPLATWLWDSFLQPIAEWTGGVIVDTLQWLADKLGAISAWISENQSLVENLAIVIGSIAVAIGLVNAATSIWNVMSATGTVITGAFGTAMQFLTSPITLVVAAIAAVIAIVVLLVKNWDTVKAAALSVWEAIKEAFGKAWKWFEDTLLNPLVDGFKGMVNGIIGFINGLIAGAVKGINSIIDVLNKLKFTVPDWVPGLGGATIGFNLKTVTAPQIPYLAKGAVLPANKPFLAMVGDQRHGTNVEAPLATIQEAMALTMEDFVASNMAGHEATVGVLREILGAVLGIHIGDAVIAQAAERYRSKMAVVRGGSY